MTRQEVTGIRELGFSQWIREKLPDSQTGFSASDLDFVLWNWKTRKVMLLEVKTRMSYPRTGQKMMWENIHKWIKNGVDGGWQYLGFHLVQFENDESFENGKCYLDNKEISEADLITFLSLL